MTRGSRRPTGGLSHTDHGTQGSDFVENRFASFTRGGALEIDLRAVDDFELERKVKRVCDAPRGVKVTLVVGARQMPHHVALRYLADNGRHLGHVEFKSDETNAICRWTVALCEAQADSDAALEHELRKRGEMV